MYLITATNEETQESVRLLLPMKDSELDSKLDDIGYTDIEKDLLLTDFQNDGYEMPHLPKAMLNNATIFEINNLAQRVEWLFSTQTEIFSAAIDAYNIENIKDLINLAIETDKDCYELFEGATDEEELGRYYVDNECYDTDDYVLANIDYSGVGEALRRDEYKEGIFCNKGFILKTSNADEWDLYDGHIMPEYDYDKDYLSKIKYILSNGDEVFLKLPATDCTIVNKSDTKKRNY